MIFRDPEHHQLNSNAHVAMKQVVLSVLIDLPKDGNVPLDKEELLILHLVVQHDLSVHHRLPDLGRHLERVGGRLQDWQLRKHLRPQQVIVREVL